MTIDVDQLATFDPSAIPTRGSSERTPSTDDEIVASQGDRNDVLTRDAGYLRRRGFSEAEIDALLQVRNRERVEPPLPEAEVRTIAHSVASYEPDDDVPDVDTLITTLTKTAVEGVRFMTPTELTEAAGAELRYVVQPYVIERAITDVIAPAKEGKTRARNHIIRGAITGAPCFGYPPCDPTAVVLLTEEPIPALMEGLRAAGLAESTKLSVLTLYEARDADWPSMVLAAREEAQRIDAKLLVIDTAPAMAGIEGEQENQTGPTLAMLPAAPGRGGGRTRRADHSTHPQGRRQSRGGGPRQLGVGRRRGRHRPGVPSEGRQTHRPTARGHREVFGRPAGADCRTRLLRRPLSQGFVVVVVIGDV